jgi:hypothetical protein
MVGDLMVVLELVVVVAGMLLSFVLGCWTTHRAYGHTSPIPSLPSITLDDMPAPISPYSERE